MPSALLSFWNTALKHLTVSLLLLQLALKLCKWVHCRFWGWFSLAFCERYIVFIELLSVDFPHTVEAPALHEWVASQDAVLRRKDVAVGLKEARI